MSAVMRRWRCPTCNEGKLAPGHARRDDARTYCFPCSEKTGRLVRRVCEAREAEAAQREQRRAAARQKQVERNAAQRQINRAAESQRLAAKRAPWTAPDARIASVGDYFKKWAALRAWECDLSDVRVSFRRGRAVRGGVGTAGCANGSVLHLTIGSDLADALDTLLHEMAHSAHDRWTKREQIADFSRRGANSAHGMTWRGFFLRAAREVTGRQIVVQGGTLQAVQLAVLTAMREWLAVRP